MVTGVGSISRPLPSALLSKETHVSWISPSQWSVASNPSVSIGCTHPFTYLLSTLSWIFYSFSLSPHLCSLFSISMASLIQAFLSGFPLRPQQVGSAAASGSDPNVAVPREPRRALHPGCLELGGLSPQRGRRCAGVAWARSQRRAAGLHHRAPPFRARRRWSAACARPLHFSLRRCCEEPAGGALGQRPRGAGHGKEGLSQPLAIGCRIDGLDFFRWRGMTWCPLSLRKL